MKQEKIHLKDYKTPAFAVSHLQLDFDLQEDFCRVKATSKIQKLREEALTLDGVDLQLVSVKIDGQKLTESQYQKTDEQLIIAQTPASFTLEVETRLEPQNNTSLEGLYKSNGIFCTQCEAQGFRKITYFLDRPDVMTSYDVTIEADQKKYPVLLSNGDRLKVEEIGGGRHRASWRDPHKKPSYLFALVAGDLGVIRDEFTTSSGRKVNLEVYAAHGKQERCMHAMASLKKAMKWDEDTFGLEYDLNDYMIVAIDDFNAGAMENKGLNIFNSRLVLADKESATDTDFQAIEAVVAHEYFHNWTGNRVTLRNWFQLSLKEGLTVFRDQEFSADMLDRGVQRIEDVDALRSSQFAEDAGPNAHPVRPESCMAVDNFFTMTIYEKGSEVIRMMQTIVGRKGFRKGMDEYFKRHDGQAVTTEDFAAAISEPNNKDFTQFKLWYSQPGTPRVVVKDSYNSSKQEYTLNLEQLRPDIPAAAEAKPFHIPLMIGLLDSRGMDMNLNCPQISKNTDGKFLIELKERSQSFVFSQVAEKPVLSLNREFSAPIKLQWETGDDSYYFLMAKDSDSFNRREAAQKMALRQFSRLIGQARAKKNLELDPAYIEALSPLLTDAQMDPAFKANMLQLPSTAMIAQQEEILDAEAFHQARLHIQKTFALANKDLLIEGYRKAHTHDDMKYRQLKSNLLTYLAPLEDTEVNDLIVQQYKQAKNMTDQMSALMLLADGKHEFRDEALNDFHERWKNDSVVINKWFTAQALSRREDTLQQVEKLCGHPSFNIQNPNNVYALLRSFGANLIRFHDPKTKAYEFYADRLLEIDAKNPQVGARLCGSFNFVGKLDTEMKARAMQQIARMVNNPGLSKNSRELLQPMLQS